MKILHIASEITPFAKTGGLADVVGSLPIIQQQLGEEIYLAMPFYKRIIKDNLKIQKDKQLKIIKSIPFEINLGGEIINGKLHLTKYRQVNVFFIENDFLFNRDSLYVHEKNGKVIDFEDNLKRFSFFSHSIFMMLQKFNLYFDIIHCHDWQTALIPVLAKNNYKYMNFTRTKFVFTIHNMAYQGIFPKEQWDITNLPEELYNMEDLEYWGDINLLKGAIKYADIITTVSPTYAEEIKTKEGGFGLDGFLMMYAHKLHGILNGIDYDYWDPSTDIFIKPYNYTKEDIGNKFKIKIELLGKYFEEPKLTLLGMVSRLTEQKGIDLLLDIFDELMQLPINLIVLGSGDKKFENALYDYLEKYKGKFYYENGYNEPLAHKIYGGSDFFIMPSFFEPCGLGQMIAMHYGTIPIVRNVGGLRDSVDPINIEKKSGTGFVIKKHDSKELLNMVKNIFNLKQKNDIINNCMNKNFSWERSAMEYIQLYKKG